MRVRRPRGSGRFNLKYTQRTVKHTAHVMVWGCYSGKQAKGTLYFLPKNETINSERYIRCLERKLLDPFKIHQSTFFMQDGAHCHTSKQTMAWFLSKGINVLEWPSNSPNLNPIEKVWKEMKSKTRRARCASIPKLMTEIKRVWI